MDEDGGEYEDDESPVDAAEAGDAGVAAAAETVDTATAIVPDAGLAEKGGVATAAARPPSRLDRLAPDGGLDDSDASLP